MLHSIDNTDPWPWTAKHHTTPIALALVREKTWGRHLLAPLYPPLAMTLGAT